MAIWHLINEHMALFKYFKRTEGHRETPPSLTTNDIKKANESIAKELDEGSTTPTRQDNEHY